MDQAITRRRQLGTQRHRGFTHDQGGEQRGQHQQGEHDVGAGPGLVQVAEPGGAEPFGEEQRACRGQQGRYPVAGHVAGGEGGLTLVIGNFQAIGIDGDVLGSRGKRHENGHGNQPRQVLLRVAQAHADQPDHHQRLGQQQP
ncbi:hypothetical protein D3C76_987400 [compost metagenome]